MATEDLPEKLAHVISYILGGGTATGAAMDLSNFGILVGVFFTALTYGTFLFFSVRRDRREQKRFDES